MKLRKKMEQLRQRMASEEGFALVLALGMTVVLSMTAVTVIASASSNERQSNLSKGRMGAYSLAEAGINNALSVLNGPNTNALQQSALPSTEAAASQKVYADGTAKWWGVLNGNSWVLHGVGLVRNSSAPGTPDNRREITAAVDVIASLTQPLNTQQWDYIMSTGTGSTCDETIADGTNTGNPATILSRLYVFGNLCIGTDQGGRGHVDGGPLMVKGKININESSSAVGSSGAYISEMHVGQGCAYLTQTLHNPCQVGAGGSPTLKDNVWATVVDSVVPNITAPVADWDGWYANAKPGPMQACSTLTGSPPQFDNNTTRNYSVYNASNTAFDLTPSASYSCTVTDQYGNLLGKLDWNASTKLLTIAGTVFIDGAAKIANGALNQYNGQGTIYLSGSFYMSPNSKMCGSVSGTDCAFSTWNPNTELLGIVANGNGVQVPTGTSIHLNDAQFQGALYATYGIRLEGITRTDGPMVASKIELGYNVSTSSATADGFPLLTTVPVGLPGAPNVHALPLPPKNFTS
jgi:hypothetical protein